MVLGLDLSSVNSGYSVIDGESLVDYGSIIPKSSMNHSEKLDFIHYHIQELCKKHKITIFAIEDQHLRFNVDTLKLLSRICGVAMLCAHQNGAEVFLYPAPTIKLTFTGNGKAEKTDMIARAMELYHLERCNIDDNIADAIGTAYTHLNYKEEPKPKRKKGTRKKKSI